MKGDGVVIGWDIGGAHLKAAVRASAGIDSVHCIQTPVWQGLESVAQAIERVMAPIGAVAEHRVTMTAELVDLFASRSDGVCQLITLIERKLGSSALRFLNANAELVDAETARRSPLLIASANWIAAARLAASEFQCGVLVDIGSTTTDVTVFNGGVLLEDAQSDLERLRAKSLLYLGVVRTPVCAWVDEVEFDGTRQAVAAELFANAADVYRVLDRIPEDADIGSTCDGRGKSWRESRDRIARMLLTDGAEHADARWLEVCSAMADDLDRRIAQAIERKLMEVEFAAPPVIVGAGVGRFLLPTIAADLGLRLREFDTIDDNARNHLPAVALATWH